MKMDVLKCELPALGAVVLSLRYAAALLVLGLAGCADKPTYEIDYDQSFIFAQYQSYRWYDDDHASRESQYRRQNSSDQHVRSIANTELLQRGFREATRGNVHFWVNYDVTKRQTQKVSGQEKGMHGGVGVSNYGKSVSVGYSSGPSVKTYEDGTAVFNVIDIRTSKIVWRGVAEG